jgi:hypothetical protein
MSHGEGFSRRRYLIGALAFLGLGTLLPTASPAAPPAPSQDEKLEERYTAFGVSMGAGAAGVLNITITRYSTEEERKLLVEALAKDGQDKMVEVLRKQKETGFARTQSGAGMKGWPSVRLYYAHQAQKDGKRVVVVLTERNMTMAERTSGGRSVDYDVSAVVMELEPVQGDEKLIEKGQGTLFRAAKLEFDKDNKLNVEYLGTQPIRLTDIKREK